MVDPNFSAHWVIPEKIHTPTMEEVFFYPPLSPGFPEAQDPPPPLLSGFPRKETPPPAWISGKKGVKVNQLFTFFTSIITRNN